AAGMESYVKDNSADYPELVDAKFKQGDIVNTIITCAGGQTILLTLDTTLPGVYDRALIIKGTKGMYNQSANYAVLDGEEREEKWTGIENTTALLNSAAKYEEKYLPDYWKNITEEQRKVGHGGMDLFMLQTFFDALENGDEMPLDVYDAASWMSVVCLSEQSIALGGVPVAIPDFTKGKWLIRPRKDVISII
ncbi:MAG TPA: gfo/Idh/MocA family oxidoreductase, partial [Clostridia bacterium]